MGGHGASLPRWYVWGHLGRDSQYVLVTSPGRLRIERAQGFPLRSFFLESRENDRLSINSSSSFASAGALLVVTPGGHWLQWCVLPMAAVDGPPNIPLRTLLAKLKA